MNVLVNFKCAHLLKQSMSTNWFICSCAFFLYDRPSISSHSEDSQHPDLNTKYKYAMSGVANTSASNNEALWGVGDGIVTL